MKISPMPSVQNQVTHNAETPNQHREIRHLKMTTNATPERFMNLAPPPDTPAAPIKDPKLGISDPNDLATAAAVTDEPLSPQLAAIARQKRALQVKERELRAREDALKAQVPVQGTGVDIARLKQEPLSVLIENGITYDQLTQALLAQQNGITPEQYRALQMKVEALETGFDKKLTEREQQAEQQALTEMKREATRLSAQGEEFELIRETRSVPEVMRLIEQTYRKTGEVLDVAEACRLVEAELLKDVQRVVGLKKVSGQETPAAPVQPQSRPQMRTLSNRDTAVQPMSAKQRALAAFWGQQIQR